MLSTSRLATATLSAAALTAGLATPSLATSAPAAPPSVDRWDVGVTSAGLDWVEEDRDDSSGRPGNVHIGGMLVESYDGTSVLSAGSLADWDCPAGAMPWDAEGTACRLVTQYEASDAAVVLHHDAQAGTARVTGTVTFFDLAGEEPAPWDASVDLTWATEGRAERSRSHDVVVSSSFKLVTHEQLLTWQVASVTGTVGSLTVGDEADEVIDQRLSHSEQRFVIWQRPEG